VERLLVIIVWIAIGAMNRDIEAIGPFHQTDPWDLTFYDPACANRWKFYPVDISVRAEDT
jgi:hypothetical protein